MNKFNKFLYKTLILIFGLFKIRILKNKYFTYHLIYQRCPNLFYNNFLFLKFTLLSLNDIIKKII